MRTLGWVLVRCGLLALVLLIVACGSSTAADSTSSTTGSTPTSVSSLACGPSAAKTLASSTAARVYESGGSIYGCARGGSRRYKLGNATTCIRSERAGPIALAGAIVAYGLEACGIDTGTSEVVVQRLSDGRKLRTLAATTGRLGPESYQVVGSVVVRRDAAVAWIAQARSIPRHSGDVEVHRADRRGRAKLDSGTSIEAGSLRLHGSTLSWRHGAASRSATLL